MTDELEQAVDKAVAELKTQAGNGKPDPAKIVDNHLAYLNKILGHLRNNEEQLELEIARLTSQLRQTRASIEAFGLAHDRLRP